MPRHQPPIDPPSWDRTFNAGLAHAYADLAAAAVAALGCGYPYLAWRGRVYRVTLNHDGKAAWPAWDDTGLRPVDVDDGPPMTCDGYGPGDGPIVAHLREHGLGVTE